MTGTSMRMQTIAVSMAPGTPETETKEVSLSD
jgi:hypothetical protein